jgi:hypothetical protein
MKHDTSLKPVPGSHFYLFGQKVTPPQQSIHPRVRNGRTAYPKSNTCKAKRNGK